MKKKGKLPFSANVVFHVVWIFGLRLKDPFLPFMCRPSKKKQTYFRSLKSENQNYIAIMAFLFCFHRYDYKKKVAGASKSTSAFFRNAVPHCVSFDWLDQFHVDHSFHWPNSFVTLSFFAQSGHSRFFFFFVLQKVKYIVQISKIVRKCFNISSHQQKHNWSEHRLLVREIQVVKGNFFQTLLLQYPIC